MSNLFKKATKAQSKLRLALVGTSGSGKTYTALTFAREFGKIAVIDTERGSASKYADLFDFDALELTDYSPKGYIDSIRNAEENGYDVIIIDSLSHAWNAPGGVLDMVDKAAKRSQSSNSFAAWRDVTPQHNALVEALTGSSAHIIVTMRAKTEYVLQPNDKGKLEPKKVGLAPVQRDGLEYEFDIVGEMNIDNELIVTKTRMSKLTGQIYSKPTGELAQEIKHWVIEGIPPHWATNGGGKRIQAKIGTLGLKWDYVRAHVEPGKTLERLSDTSLNEDQFGVRLDELKQGLDFEQTADAAH